SEETASGRGGGRSGKLREWRGKTRVAASAEEGLLLPRDSARAEGDQLCSGGVLLLEGLLAKLSSAHAFSNLQVEMLYQRYFLRTNQSHLTHLLGLLAALASLLGGWQLVGGLSPTSQSPASLLANAPLLAAIACLITYS
ncbi:adenylate cyclase type 5-like, partial [Nilaparvata lugens]|uniref:adenylate cyclase type 5-like n=1 Tax=Nilaparvata lugens TaxID=108931 RepID=UPI00193D0B12